MRVRDVMTSANLTTARPEDDVAVAMQMMLWTNTRHLPVVRDGKVIGVVSERDLLRRGEEGKAAGTVFSVEEVMRSPPVTIDPDAPLITAVSMMLSRKIGCLPVVAGDALVGMLTTTDLLRHELDTAIERPASGLPPAVRAVMKPAPAVVTADSELFDAAALMGARGVRHLPVVDREHKVVGILSDRDVRSALGDPGRFLAEPDAREQIRGKLVVDVMSNEIVTVPADAPLTVAIDRLVDQRIGALPVVGVDGKLVGMLSYLDIVQALRARS